MKSNDLSRPTRNLLGRLKVSDYVLPNWSTGQPPFLAGAAFFNGRAMDVRAYTRQELDFFAKLLGDAHDLTLAQNLNLPIPLLANRLFEAASTGERDPDILTGRMLAAANSSGL